MAKLMAHEKPPHNWLSHSEFQRNHKTTEDPWRKVRIGVPDGERGTAPITEEFLGEYYGNLQANVS